MSQIVIIKIERIGARLATTLETKGEDMHPLAILQGLGELQAIILKRHMEETLDSVAFGIKENNPNKESPQA